MFSLLFPLSQLSSLAFKLTLADQIMVWQQVLFFFFLEKFPSWAKLTSGNTPRYQNNKGTPNLLLEDWDHKGMIKCRGATSTAKVWRLQENRGGKKGCEQHRDWDRGHPTERREHFSITPLSSLLFRPLEPGGSRRRSSKVEFLLCWTIPCRRSRQRCWPGAGAARGVNAHPIDPAGRKLEIFVPSLLKCGSGERDAKGFSPGGTKKGGIPVKKGDFKYHQWLMSHRHQETLRVQRQSIGSV